MRFLVHLCLLNPFDAITAFTFHANCCGPRSWLRGDSEFTDLALMKIVASESRSLFVRCCSSAQEILKCGTCKWPTCHDSNFLDVDPGQLSCGTAHCLHDTGRWICTYWSLLMSCLAAYWWLLNFASLPLSRYPAMRCPWALSERNSLYWYLCNLCIVDPKPPWKMSKVVDKHPSKTQRLRAWKKFDQIQVACQPRGAAAVCNKM